MQPSFRGKCGEEDSICSQDGDKVAFTVRFPACSRTKAFPPISRLVRDG